jgi:hypothetical protein
MARTAPLVASDLSQVFGEGLVAVLSDRRINRLLSEKKLPAT